MGVSYLSISAVCTVLSFVGLQYWTGASLEKLKSDGVIDENFIHSGNASHALELLMGSPTTIALVANFSINIFVLLILCLKTIFFVELYSSEIRKLLERLINYIIYKGTFLPLVVPSTIFHTGLWSAWLIVLCSLKVPSYTLKQWLCGTKNKWLLCSISHMCIEQMFQALARDRLERLNASPSAAPCTYFRVYSVLLLVLFVNLLWIRLCLMIYRAISSPMFFLLFFEPFSIVFETLQAILVHGFQLLDIWLHHSAGSAVNCRMSKLFDISAAGSLWEWKSTLIRNAGFFLDMMTLLMALGHYVHIWWLHGMAFHLVDVVLFLNIRALLSAVVKRIKGYVKLRIALGTLHGALPDATSEELRAYDDECAICREPMAKAKKLSCKHLFHLACLRSWLDQGLSDNYSCPTCRKPLFEGRYDESNPHTAEVLNRQNIPRHNLPLGAFPNQMQNPLDNDWREAEIDSSWLGLDGAGPSTAIRSVGLGRVQMVMRQLAAVGETYAQTALEDASWNLWPMNPSQPGTSTTPVPPPGSIRPPGTAANLHMRTTHAASDNIANIIAMAETVREVLPHIPDELIFQDLQRTNSVTVTVNNLLQM